jgi:hypothetical protein
MSKINSIKTVSQYFALGGFSIGMLMESPVKETEKALAFSAVRHNSYGNAYQSVTWLPKSQLVELENDHYTQDAPASFYLCPMWLYKKSFVNGETL